MFTAPAYFMTIVVGMTLYLLKHHFVDRERSGKPKDVKKKSAKRAAIDDFANQMTTVGLSIYDCCILGCMMMNVSTQGNMGTFETLGVAVAESQFNLSATLAGSIVGTCGTIGVISLLSMGRLSQIFSDIQLICGGMTMMSAGILFLSLMEEDGDNDSWRFLISIFMIYSVGYPIGHTAVIGMFSKSKFLA